MLDKKYTDKVNLDNNIFKLVIYNLQWRRNSKKQVEILKPLIAKYGFPGERLIGFPDTIYNSSRYKENFWNSYLVRSSAGTMLTHFFSIRRKDLNYLLFPNIKTGHLKPIEYAGFNDFLGQWGKKKYNNYHYNSWHKDKDLSHLPDIEKRRVEIGMETFTRQEEKLEMFNVQKHTTSEKNRKIILEIF